MVALQAWEKATAKPKKGGSPGIVPDIESGGGGRGGPGRGGKGAREGGGGARGDADF